MGRAIAVLFFLCIACAGYAGDHATPLRAPGTPAIQTTGNLRIDLLGQTEFMTAPHLQQEGEGEEEAPRYESPWLAGSMSLVVPGSGELYTGSYIKSAAFFAVEVAAWIFAYTYDKKGDRQTDFFQDYANAHWSVVQYAEQAQFLAPAGQTYNWRVPGTEGWSPWYRPWEQVNWSELNRMEQDISVTYSYYTHILPPYGQQQYFELIGKYQQFNQGWDDAYILPGSNPYIYGPNNVTPRFSYYAHERGQANTYYTTASTFVSIAVANHIVSTIDAYFTARAHNKVHAEVGSRIVPTGTGGYAQVPVLTLSYGI